MDYRNLYDGIEEQIKLPNGALITPINFDNGATTPPLKSVTKIISDNIKNYGPIARGVGFKGEYCTNMFEDCRNKILDFFGLDGCNSHTVVYTKSDTESLNILANTLINNKDDMILTSRMEHHANDLPFRNVGKVVYVDANAGNDFLPLPDKSVKADIIYLCSPNNPTGAVYNKEQLKAWVDYANAHHSVILFDAAYEAFITDNSIPKSIYEIEGARTCAIELRSFSKTAGFTGVRCGYTVVPHDLVFDGTELNAMWFRRQSTKFNGVSYITQRAAEAIYSDIGQKQIQENLNYYRENAKIIFDGLTEAGFKCYGGIYSPYIWFKVPEGYTSWSFFDELLDQCNVVGTPGSGFGKCGEGFLRLTAFGNKERTIEAVERIKAKYGKK